MSIFIRKNIENSKSSGDWLSYSFEQLVSDSDLVVYGEISSTQSVNSNPPSQESNLRVLKVLKGDETNTTIVINLSDPSYYVKSKSKYVMFLDNTGSFYTQKTYNSLLMEENGVISSSLQGLSEEFTIDEVQSEISNVISHQ